MAQALSSIRKSISDHGKLIMIIGRESNVKKTPFYNGKIIKDICNQTHLFLMTDESIRFFKNKFGTTIYEDILTLEPNNFNDNTDESACRIAISHLKEALERVPAESVSDLEKAIKL
jgi:hypothetical protein